MGGGLTGQRGHCCLHRALEIARLPLVEWKGALEEVPAVCADAARCGDTRGCREVNAEYLRVQYGIAARKAEQAPAKAVQR